MSGNGPSKKQKVQSEKVIPKTNVSVIESPEKPVKKFGIHEIEVKEKNDSVSYWTSYRTWSKNFVEYNLMVSSNSTNKKQKTSDRFQSDKNENF